MTWAFAVDQRASRAGVWQRSFPGLTRSPVARRVASGTAANLVDKVVLLAVQLVSIPVLTRAWGPQAYGTWLMLMTIPSYLMVGDLGLGAALQVEMGRLVAAGRRDAALQAFQSAWVMSSAVVALLVVAVIGCAAAALLLPPAGADHTLPVAAIWAALLAAASIQTGLLLAAFRATGKYALGGLVNTAVLAAEGLSVMAAASAGGGLVVASAAQAVVGVAGFAVMLVVLRHRELWIGLGVRQASGAAVRRLLHPSAAALTLTVATALSLQGMVLVVGLAGGAATAGAFASARFLTRIPLQFAGLVSRASVPELIRSQANDNGPLTHRLNAVNLTTALLATLPFAVALWFVGPPLLQWMSHGALDAEPLVFLLLGSAAAFSALAGAAAAPLLATNRQGVFAYGYLALSAVSLAAPFTGGSPLLLAAAAMAAAELVNLGLVVRGLRARR